MNTPRVAGVAGRLARFPIRLALLGCLIAGALSLQAQHEVAAKSKAPSSGKAKTTVATAPKEMSVMITGSRVPRKIKAGARTADLDLSVAIIRKHQIDQIGGTSLRDSLRKQVSGR